MRRLRKIYYDPNSDLYFAYSTNIDLKSMMETRQFGYLLQDDSIIWDSSKIYLKDILELESISDKEKLIISNNSDLDISNDDISMLSFNSFDYNWSFEDLKRKDYEFSYINTVIEEKNWSLSRKKSGYRNPHTYLKYKLYWDPKSITFFDILKSDLFNKVGARSDFTKINRSINLDQLI